MGDETNNGFFDSVPQAVKDKEGGAMAFDDMAELEMERLRGDWD